MEIEMKKKEANYKGKTLEELKSLETREFAKYVESRARRTILRQFREIENFVNRANKKILKKKPIKTHHRYLVVVPKMLGMKIQIHNGQKFIPTEIVMDMLGHKFGEFAPTRARVKHGSAGVGSSKGTRSKAKK
jgi:small subunit ribosomal protein S19